MSPQFLHMGVVPRCLQPTSYGPEHQDLLADDKGTKHKKDLQRRTSSGNWIEDRVTWKEELYYKKAMGYV